MNQQNKLIIKQRPHLLVKTKSISNFKLTFQNGKQINTPLSSSSHQDQKKQTSISNYEQSALRKKFALLNESNYSYLKLSSQLDLKNQKDSQLLIQLLLKSFRSKIDNEIIEKAVCSIPFFQDSKKTLNEQLYKEIFKDLIYMHKPKGTVLFNYGDQGEYYYVILKGSVYILIPKEDPEEILQEQQRIDQEMKLQQEKKQYRNSVQGMLFKKKFQSFQLGEAEASQSATYNNKQLEEMMKNSPLIISNQNSPQKQSQNNQQTQQQFSHKKSKFSQPNLLQKRVMRKKENMQENNATQENIDRYSNANQVVSKQQIQSRFPFYNLVNILSQGEGFGEIAFITKQKRYLILVQIMTFILNRSATVVCREDSHFLILNRQSYDKIFSQYYVVLLMQKVKFLKHFAMFKGWTDYQLSEILQSFEIKQFKMNDIVYKEGDSSEFLYFIKDGEVEISKLETLQLNSIKNQQLRHELQLVSPNLTQKRMNNIKRINIAKFIGPNYFGEEEFIKDVQRMSRVTCIADSLIYKIQRKKLLQFLNIYNLKNSLQILLDEGLSKQLFRVNQIQKSIKINNQFRATQEVKYNMRKEQKQSNTKLKLKQILQSNGIINSNKNKRYGSQQEFDSNSQKNHSIIQQKFESDVKSFTERTSLTNSRINLFAQTLYRNSQNEKDIESKNDYIKRRKDIELKYLYKNNQQNKGKQNNIQETDIFYQQIDNQLNKINEKCLKQCGLKLKDQLFLVKNSLINSISKDEFFKYSVRNQRKILLKRHKFHYKNYKNKEIAIKNFSYNILNSSNNSQQSKNSNFSFYSQHQQNSQKINQNPQIINIHTNIKRLLKLKKFKSDNYQQKYLKF